MVKLYILNTLNAHCIPQTQKIVLHTITCIYKAWVCV